MTLNENQREVLQAINTLQIQSGGDNIADSRGVAELTNFDLDTVEYFFDTLVADGCVKSVVKQASFEGIQFYAVRITPKGKVAITNPDNLVQPSNPAISQVFNGAVGAVMNASYSTANVTQYINQNTSEVLEAIRNLHQLIGEFPEEQRDDADVLLTDLEAEISAPDKRDPRKVKFYLKQLLTIGSAVALVIAGGVAFTDQVLGIAQKLGYPVETIQLPPVRPTEP
jgi:ABC-type dipeptide/oligopeptide/nickel transport system ATPase component